MAITLEANYCKKVGLPGYSSHQYSLTVKTEVSEVKEVEARSSELYAQLQSCVDRDIQETGFLPETSHNNQRSNGYFQNHQNGNGNANGSGSRYTNNHKNNGHQSNGNGNGQRRGNDEVWQCSDKQKSLILKLVDEHHLDKEEVESLAQDRFGKGVRFLNKIEAGGLIQELIETHEPKNGQRQSGHRQPSR